MHVQFDYCFCAQPPLSAAVNELRRWAHEKVVRIASVILLIVFAGCTRPEGLPVRFVVPDGYRGVITITITPGSGIPVPVTNGEFLVTIPVSGKLSVSSSDFLTGKHVFSARYASGQPLPPGHDPMAIALRLVTVTPDIKTVFYVVGTQKEEDDEFKKH